MKICVIGTGYVGLVAGACFADSGNDVICVDQDLSKIEALKKGLIPIYEPGLEELVRRGMVERRLSFTNDTASAVSSAEVIFLAVGTPSGVDGQPDLRYLESAARQVAKSISGNPVIVNKSTVPIGAHVKVAEWIRSVTNESFEVVSNPEFLKEGSAIEDFLKPDRVVIGATSDRAFEKMVELYSPFLRQGNPLLKMDPISAEMTKYACNSFLATRISFMNELATLCDRVGGDIELIRKGMSTDVRIGKYFLYAGVGYGGSCFPKDIDALVGTGKSCGLTLGVVEAAQKANLRQRDWFVDKVLKSFDGNLAERVFAVWGLSFKPNTDDLRDAPALAILKKLESFGARFQVFDPVSMDHCKKLHPPSKSWRYCETSYDALQGADALLLITEWNEFRSPDWKRVQKLMKQPWVFDGRNIYDPAALNRMGFQYWGVGRRP